MEKTGEEELTGGPVGPGRFLISPFLVTLQGL